MLGNRPARQNDLERKNIAKVVAKIIASRSDFLYTKNAAQPRSDFLYTKNFAPPRSDFISTNFGRPGYFGWDFEEIVQKIRGTMWQKVTIFKEGIWIRLAGFEVHKLKIEGDDVTKGDDFQKRSSSSVGRIWGPQIQKLGRWVSGDAFHAHIFSLIYKSHSVSNCNSGWHIANLARTRQISGESIPANQFSSFLSFGIERFSNLWIWEVEN